MGKKSPNPRMAFSKRSREESGVNNEAKYWGGGDKPMVVPGKISVVYKIECCYD